MLGRKTYTREEIDQAKAMVAEQQAAYTRLLRAVAGTTPDQEVETALDALEVQLFTTLLLALDRRFVHRVRLVTGKDGNPLNEVELLCDSLINHGGVLATSTVIKLVPGQSVLRLQPGDPIRVTAEQFDRLSRAFFAELETRFASSPG